MTSPPFATALPYIDTDRLSLLAIMGISSKGRANLEEVLTGSREITVQEKRTVESQLLDKSAEDILPSDVVNAIRGILDAQKSHEVGFRRANMPSLLWRYFMDMKENLLQVTNVLKSEAKAFYVVGDSRTSAGEEWIQIKTCQSIKLIGEMAGLRHVDTLNINVTKENFKNIKNAITENQVIVFEKI